ncbi:hypothetical protein LINPERPRIM_LOCUS24751 [Linum perenne]
MNSISRAPLPLHDSHQRHDVSPSDFAFSSDSAASILLLAIQPPALSTPPPPPLPTQPPSSYSSEARIAPFRNKPIDKWQRKT